MFQAVTDKTTGDCLMNCGEPGFPDSLQPEIPEDRRYWLLTVIQGSTPDSLQLRLARLYQKAFLRSELMKLIKIIERKFGILIVVVVFTNNLLKYLLTNKRTEFDTIYNSFITVY